MRKYCKTYELWCIPNILSFNSNKYSLKMIIFGKRETPFEKHWEGTFETGSDLLHQNMSASTPGYFAPVTSAKSYLAPAARVGLASSDQSARYT